MRELGPEGTKVSPASGRGFLAPFDPASPTSLSTSAFGDAVTVGGSSRRDRGSSIEGPVSSYFASQIAPCLTNLALSRGFGLQEYRGPLSRSFSQFVPIYTDVEQAIIGSNTFQRLGGVQQMAFGYASGARESSEATNRQFFRHTRANHSQGVLKVAAFIAEQNQQVLPSHVALAFKIAALLHDIGHVPFSHAGESILQQNPRFNVNGKPFDHDAYAASQILGGELGEIIRQLGAKHGVTPEMIVEILNDRYGLGVAITEICDRYDYLVRDFAGTRFAAPVRADISEVSECCLGARFMLAQGADANNFSPSDYIPVLNGDPVRGQHPSYWKFLALRQILYQEYSVHPQAEVVTACLELALQEAFQKGKFHGVDFRALTDREAIDRFLPRARKMFSDRQRISVDERYESVGHCTLQDVKDHNFVASPRFAENVKAHLLNAFPKLTPWDLFFRTTPGYAKNLRLHVESRGEKPKLVTERFEPRLAHRHAFLVVSKEMPSGTKEAVQAEFAAFMSDHLGSGKRLAQYNLLPRHVDFKLFLSMVGASHALSSRT